MAKRSPSRARDLYRSMHAGLEPRHSVVRAPPVPKAVIDLRRMVEVIGIQDMGPQRRQGSGPIYYRHTFAPGTGPMMQVDLGRDRNNLILSGGSYRVNREGMIEDVMAKHHSMHRYHRNPESTITFLALVGLALGLTTIVADLIQSLMPASWNSGWKYRVKTLGMDALLVIGGAALYKKSPVWGIALAAAGVSDAVNVAYIGLGLDTRIQSALHRTTAGLGGLTNRPSGALPDGQQRIGGFNRPNIGVRAVA